MKSISVVICLLAFGSQALGAQAIERPLPGPLSSPAAHVAAVARGTRSTTGSPGEAYWQQRADYAIEARLDVETARVQAREIVTYSNNSPGALESVVFHLDQNVYAPGARRNRRTPITGGMSIESISVNGEEIEIPGHGRGYYAALTLMEVPLPTPLASGSSATIEFAWSFTVPPAPTFRNGNLDFRVFSVAQWYPRVAVFDDVYGWDRTPYQGDGEFYLEYGDFDVRLTVPSGWLIGATGELSNPGDVLSKEALTRYESVMTSSEVVHVVSADDVPDTRGEQATWRFVAENVRDFAWSTSNEYVWDAVRVGIPGGKGASAMAQALYRPEFEVWREVARYAAHTISSYSKMLGAYPYPQLTITEGPVGGMEYPMMVFNPGGSSERGAAGVTIHEGGHQWFPMIVGSMEAKHAWMDEGFNSYFDELSSADLWGEDPTPWGDNGQYLRSAGTEREVPLMLHTDNVSPYGERTLAAYRKPAVMLGALREVIGDKVFEVAFQDYVLKWAYKHPQPTDFFNLIEEHAGQDLDWFWRPLIYGTELLDHGVSAVSYDGTKTTITIVDEGDVFLPTPVRITLVDGAVVDELIPESVWLAGTRSHTLEVRGEVATVEIDPQHLFPDVDRENSVWPR